MRGNNFDYIKSLQDDIYYYLLFCVLDSIWRTRMSYSKSKLLCCFCYNLFLISFCLLDSTCHVHCCWVAKNEGTIIFESMQGYYSETAILCSFSCISYTRRIFYITGMYKQIYVEKVFLTHILIYFKIFYRLLSKRAGPEVCCQRIIRCFWVDHRWLFVFGPRCFIWGIFDGTNLSFCQNLFWPLLSST